ncbi:MAG: hypothetical protein AB7I29_13750 [Geobacter sp.]
MTPQAMAEQLDGREYPFELSKEEKEFMEQQGLVVVFGESDDLMEFDGAIYDEGYCYNGETFLIDKTGLLPDWNDINDKESDAADYLKRKPNAKQIEAIWGKDGISWQYKTDIPHATFKIMEDGKVYCIGIVFDIKELEAKA